MLFQDSFRQVEIPGKGQGLVASTNIPKGSRVLSEAPVLVFPGATYTVLEIILAFLALDDYKRAAYLKLYAHLSPARKTYIRAKAGPLYEDMTPLSRRVLSIFLTNDFGGRIYLTASRFNHSCAPNIEYAWNENLGRGTFHAIKDIDKDEELTLSYVVSANRTKLQRSRSLADNGIICTCPLCQDTIKARMDDLERIERRKELKFLAVSDNLGDATDWQRCEKICVYMATSQQAEGALTRQLSKL